MRKWGLFTFLLLSNILIFGQQADSLKNRKEQQEFLAVYSYALQYDDMGTAAYALTNYLMKGGAANFKDTLALVYYRTNNLNGAYRLAKEVQEKNAKNITALSLLADITGRAGDTKASLDWYEKLTAEAPTPYNFYQLATRQFLLERIGECRISLQKAIIDSAKAREQQVSLEIMAGNSETVPVMAAAYNMLGALAFRDKQTATARKFYQQAIQEFPNFIIARQNLEGLKEKPAATKPAGAKTKS